ncbi:hypothetical protein DPMN_051714 [Dreissena polymorpha]|uniref:Uncharacterized protein n=1 Tax=Dreissena polymorpha TaxID=45954 RepID=A0A9D4HMD7_DREPO|nr:hypothetical protein DPMN_051714 [Dreissena polymorpha]
MSQRSGNQLVNQSTVRESAFISESGMREMSISELMSEFCVMSELSVSESVISESSVSQSVMNESVMIISESCIESGSKSGMSGSWIMNRRWAMIKLFRRERWREGGREGGREVLK